MERSSRSASVGSVIIHTGFDRPENKSMSIRSIIPSRMVQQLVAAAPYSSPELGAINAGWTTGSVRSQVSGWQV
jgi:hypothetical protein